MGCCGERPWSLHWQTVATKKLTNGCGWLSYLALKRRWGLLSWQHAFPNGKLLIGRTVGLSRTPQAAYPFPAAGCAHGSSERAERGRRRAGLQPTDAPVGTRQALRPKGPRESRPLNLWGSLLGFPFDFLFCFFSGIPCWDHVLTVKVPKRESAFLIPLGA